MRYSKQRELILNAVLKNKIHPTAKTIYEILKDDNPGLSLGTVYRNLNCLAENNMLRKIIAPDGFDHFDGTLAHHQHMMCRKCGRIFDIDVAELNSVRKNIYNSFDFDIDPDAVVFEGVCGKCRRNS